MGPLPLIAAKHQSSGPENCRLNGDRKSHYVRKIKHVQIVRPFGTEWILTIWDRMDFLHEVQFSAGIGPAHFLAETTRPLRYCLCAAKADPMNGAPSSNSDIAAFRRLPFSPYFYIPYLFAKWQWILRKKSWGKSDITSDTHTQTTGMNSE